MLNRLFYFLYISSNTQTLPAQLTICSDIYAAMYLEIGDLNLYALDYPVCTEDSRSPKSGAGKSKFGRSQRTWLMNHMLGALDELTAAPAASSEGNGGVQQGSVQKAKESAAVQSMRKQLKLQPVDGYEPCADDYMTSYLNQASVKTALHVKSDVEWVDCSRILR